MKPLPRSPTPHHPLLNLTLEILPSHQVRYIIIVLLLRLAALPAVLLLQILIALGQFAQRGEGVGPELVEDAGDEFGEFFVFAGAVDRECVGGDGGVDWW